jgi:Cu/Ag efflux pump CusA
VANVAIWGQRDRQYQVLVDPARLRAHELTLDAVMRAAGDAVMVSGGGFVDSPNQRLAVRHLTPVVEAEDLARTIVDFRNGAPIRLGNVAEVRIGYPAPIGDAVINDGPGLLLIVEKQPWGNTLSVTRNVEAALAALKPGLKDLDVDSTIFRPATFIERSLANLQHACCSAADSSWWCFSRSSSSGVRRSSTSSPFRSRSSPPQRCLLGRHRQYNGPRRTCHRRWRGGG